MFQPAKATSFSSCTTMRIPLFLTTLFVLFINLLPLSVGKRPVWNIGHMVNSIEQVQAFLDNGANAIEVDIDFDDSGEPFRTYHGAPCDCGRICNRTSRTDFYLMHMEKVTNPGSSQYRSELTLLFLDLKLKKNFKYDTRKYGIQRLFEMIAEYFRKSKSELQFLMSIPTSEDIKLIQVAFATLDEMGASHLQRSIGWDVYSYENISTIRETYNALNLSMHDMQIWQGDGAVNCLNRRSTRLQEAIKARDSKDYNLFYPRKVVWWTIDDKTSMRKTIGLGVDAIITNFPLRLKEVLKEEYNDVNLEFRLATLYDNVWEKYDTMKQMGVTEDLVIRKGYHPMTDDPNYVPF